MLCFMKRQQQLSQQHGHTGDGAISPPVHWAAVPVPPEQTMSGTKGEREEETEVKFRKRNHTQKKTPPANRIAAQTAKAGIWGF